MVCAHIQCLNFRVFGKDSKRRDVNHETLKLSWFPEEYLFLHTCVESNYRIRFNHGPLIDNQCGVDQFCNRIKSYGADNNAVREFKHFLINILQSSCLTSTYNLNSRSTHHPFLELLTA